MPLQRLQCRHGRLHHCWRNRAAGGRGGRVDAGKCALRIYWRRSRLEGRRAGGPLEHGPYQELGVGLSTYFAASAVRVDAIADGRLAEGQAIKRRA